MILHWVHGLVIQYCTRIIIKIFIRDLVCSVNTIILNVIFILKLYNAYIHLIVSIHIEHSEVSVDL